MPDAGGFCRLPGTLVVLTSFGTVAAAVAPLSLPIFPRPPKFPQQPFRITHVNKAWTDLCGFELEECQGKSLSILQVRSPVSNLYCKIMHA